MAKTTLSLFTRLATGGKTTAWWTYVLAALFMPLWWAYIGVMFLQKRRETGWAKYAWPVGLAIGGPLDALTNWIVATVYFADLPREFMLTQRLNRYCATQPTSWRGRVARVVCDEYLDKHDPDGDHCCPNKRK